MLEFYETILNTQTWDPAKIISILNRVIKLEILEDEDNIDMNNVYKKLDEFGLNVLNINLNELYREMKDYNFIIMSYQDLEHNFNYLLIDPNYHKFVKNNDKKSPLYFEAWPSEILQNINPSLLKNLLKDKYSYITDKEIQDYLRSFTDKDVNMNLETLISGNYKERRRRF